VETIYRYRLHSMPHMHMHDTHMHVDMRAQPITMTDALICRPSMLCNSCMLVGVKGGGGGGGGKPPLVRTSAGRHVLILR